MLRIPPLLRILTVAAILAGGGAAAYAADLCPGAGAASAINQELRRLSQWIGPSRVPARSPMTLGLRN